MVWGMIPQKGSLTSTHQGGGVAPTSDSMWGQHATSGCQMSPGRAYVPNDGAALAEGPLCPIPLLLVAVYTLPGAHIAGRWGGSSLDLGVI